VTASGLHWSPRCDSVALRRLALTRDGFLVVRLDEAAASHAARWLPLHAMDLGAADLDAADLDAASPATGSRCVITADTGALEDLPEPPTSPPVARLGDAALWMADGAALLAGPGIRGVIEPGAGTATLRFTADVTGLTALHGLSMAAALLLAAADRWLVHAAAVADPDGRVFLLAGDTHAGKSTTALNLARAGWTLLSDDHVVVWRRAGVWTAEGWPRPSHLDTGWPDGAPTGVREARDPRDIPGIRLTGPGPVAGVLLPRVDRDAAYTVVARATSAAALTALLRQSAWSLTDPAAAPATLAAMADVARLPCHALTLARDTFNDPALLRSRVAAAVNAAPGTRG
jgi:hypothetical protein